jgi:hypothetical protein
VCYKQQLLSTASQVLSATTRSQVNHFRDLPASASVGSAVPRLPAGKGRAGLMDVALYRRSVMSAQKLKAW